MKNTLNKTTDRLLACFCFCLFLLGSVLPLISANILNAQQWRKDLKFLAQKVAQEHRNPFDRIGP